MTAAAPAYDVVIAGGGMVGASLACALAALPLRVAVVEAVPVDSDAQPSFDLRTTALSRGSQRILATLGIWDRLAADAAAIRRIHVSEQGRFGTAVIDARQQGVAALGYVVENRRLGAALWAQLRAAPRVDLFCPARIGAVMPEPAATSVSLEADGPVNSLTGRLLVVADGARSALRSALGIEARERSYGQAAVVGTVAVSAPGDGATAYERFTPDGPLALLPGAAGRYVFVLTRRAELAEATLQMPDAAFIELLQRSFGHRLGRFQRVGQRAAYPLSLVRAGAVTAPRTVLIGNAAQFLHPVAGQGYNLGLRDAAALAEILADTLTAGGADPGLPGVLAAYRQWRQRDQRSVVAFTDGLVRLFGLQAPGCGVVRGAGLALFDLSPTAKRGLARYTMGQAGRVSRLARGLPL